MSDICGWQLQAQYESEASGASDAATLLKEAEERSEELLAEGTQLQQKVLLVAMRLCAE